jgi:endonuclease YncB( thermonuclease family)
MVRCLASRYAATVIAALATTGLWPAASHGIALPLGAFLGQADVAASQCDGTLTLRDGRRVHLDGIETPHRSLGDRTVKPWPLAAQACQTLRELTAGSLALYRSGRDEDRYGRLPAQAFTADGRWVQGELLRRGAARVATTPDNRLLAPALLLAETEARDSRQGMWGDPATALRRPEEAVHLTDSIQVVEGPVSSANMTRDADYLNFGEDWRRSLGVRIPRAVLSKLVVDPLSLAGHRIRVRGWISKGVGPIIEISHPEQLEVIDAAVTMEEK